MQYDISCPVKINITLRVLARRTDGYHDIVSVFWKKNGVDRLTIRPLYGENTEDRLFSKGINIQGPNLVTQAAEWIRKQGCRLEPLDIVLDKKLPPGSGIGAGSGNAAALLSWISEHFGFKPEAEKTAELGADVAFLASDFKTAIALSKGEKLMETTPLPNMVWVLAFPVWQSNTAAAYAKLDNYRERNNITAASEPCCILECESILASLRQKNRVGLLPNDFLAPLMEEHPKYSVMCDVAANSDALGWGLCGSGSAFFALYEDITGSELFSSNLRKEDWIFKIYTLE